ncbi:MAG: 6-carboxytetrahydropterin synthase [Phycisphaerae bacterium]|nr:6-carboxytetrahydropterin synthase [Phycisphaerae bacterium]
MFLLEIATEFCAAHAIVIGGAREALHGHNFHVTVTVAGEQLDNEGLLCDFHAVERSLEQIITPFRDGNLNTTPPFDRVNPTAERIAHHIGVALGVMLPPAVHVASVRVTEAARCAAIYRPTHPAADLQPVP